MEYDGNRLGFVAARMLAVYFLSCGVIELTYFPDAISDLIYHFGAHSVISLDPTPQEAFYRRHYLLWFVALLVRTILYLGAAGAFYRAGPAIGRLFQPGNA